jgi:TPP-dependent pyruvate/acetoin dehydrogenase alpha subunit
VVFFCKNNQWAISCPFSRQTAAPCLAVRAAGYGFVGWRVDGNDVLAVHVATRAAVEKARNGGGPTLIESHTYRIGPHSTSDDPRRYRDEEEVEQWKAKDPIIRFRRYLESKGLWSSADEERLIKELEAEVEAAINAAENLPPPALETLFEDVYEVPTWNLREQLECARGK